MEFTNQDKKLYQQLIREPLSMWIAFPLLMVFTVAWIWAKNYTGWSWMQDFHVEFPLFLFFIHLTHVSRISDAHRKLLRRLAEGHPDLEDGQSKISTSGST